MGRVGQDGPVFETAWSTAMRIDRSPESRSLQIVVEDRIDAIGAILALEALRLDERQQVDWQAIKLVRAPPMRTTERKRSGTADGRSSYAEVDGRWVLHLHDDLVDMLVKAVLHYGINGSRNGFHVDVELDDRGGGPTIDLTLRFGEPLPPVALSRVENLLL